MGNLGRELTDKVTYQPIVGIPRASSDWGLRDGISVLFWVGRRLLWFGSTRTYKGFSALTSRISSLTHSYRLSMLHLFNVKQVLSILEFKFSGYCARARLLVLRFLSHLVELSQEY
jgi:hypothetical protein